MKYLAEYMLGWTGPSNMKADKGTIVHKVMELLAFAKLRHPKRYVDKETKISLTVKSDIDKIAEKVFYFYTSQIHHHDWKEGDLRECVRWVHKCVEQNDGVFDPRKLNIIDAEPHFDIELPYEWADYDYIYMGEQLKGKLRIKGTIDLVTKIADDTYEIIDWKTGKRLDWATGKVKSQEVLQNDFQLRLYHLAVHNMYPTIDQFLMTINYINDGGAFTVHFDQHDIPDTLAMTRKKFEKIKNNKNPALLYEERPGDAWKCRRLCHLSKETFEGKGTKPLTETRHGQQANKGDYMSMCDQLKYTIERRPIELAIDNMSKEGHSVRHYRSPGSV
jgi:hypothetical protein